MQLKQIKWGLSTLLYRWVILCNFIDLCSSPRPFYMYQDAYLYTCTLIQQQLEKLEEETVKWCREILSNSPMALRVTKSALNAVDDGHAGLQVYILYLKYITCFHPARQAILSILYSWYFRFDYSPNSCVANSQQFAGDATLLFYGTEEGTEGKTAYLNRRKPDFSRFPRLPWLLY